VSDVHITPAIRERLRALESETGTITPEALVDDARADDSPLHELFEWDNSVAAEKFRLHQARVVLKSVRYIEGQSEHITLDRPFYVRDPSMPANEQGYVSVLALQKDPVSARQSLRLEFSRVEGALSRARAVAGVLGLQDEVEHLIAQVTRVKEQAEAA
jgi:hypothetical protein